jgi:hypothetical protein
VCTNLDTLNPWFCIASVSHSLPPSPPSYERTGESRTTAWSLHLLRHTFINRLSGSSSLYTINKVTTLLLCKYDGNLISLPVRHWDPPLDKVFCYYMCLICSGQKGQETGRRRQLSAATLLSLSDSCMCRTSSICLGPFAAERRKQPVSVAEANQEYGHYTAVERLASLLCGADNHGPCNLKTGVRHRVAAG